MREGMANQVLLYGIPENIKVKRVSVLNDSILYPYNESINNRLNKFPTIYINYNRKKAVETFKSRLIDTLSRFNKHEGELTGSGPFMQVRLSNSGLLPDGTRLATRQDLEEAISSDKNFLFGNYTTFGLALITENYYPNHLLAERLSKQLRKRGIKLDKGKLIPLTALKLREDENSHYGLVFDLNEQANKETIRDLDEFKWDYTKNGGLTCAHLFKGKYWTYNDMRLEHSRDDGRVVMVSECEIPLQKILEERFLQTIIDEENKKIVKSGLYDFKIFNNFMSSLFNTGD